jgi:hypothetical protein
MELRFTNVYFHGFTLITLQYLQLILLFLIPNLYVDCRIMFFFLYLFSCISFTEIKKESFENHIFGFVKITENTIWCKDNYVIVKISELLQSLRVMLHIIESVLKLSGGTKDKRNNA